MSTAATAVVVVVALTAVLAATLAIVAMTATTASEVLHEMADFCLCGIAILQHAASEIECLTSQGVVEVYLHFLFAHFHDTTVEATAFLVLQRNDGLGIDVLVVEVSVDAEYLAVEVKHSFVAVFAIAVFLAECEAELLALWNGCDSVLKLVECESKATDKGERLVFLGLFYEMATVLIVDEQLI